MTSASSRVCFCCGVMPTAGRSSTTLLGDDSTLLRFQRIDRERRRDRCRWNLFLFARSAKLAVDDETAMKTDWSVI